MVLGTRLGLAGVKIHFLVIRLNHKSFRSLQRMLLCSMFDNPLYMGLSVLFMLYYIVQCYSGVVL